MGLCKIQNKTLLVVLLLNNLHMFNCGCSLGGKSAVYQRVKRFQELGFSLYQSRICCHHLSTMR